MFTSSESADPIHQAAAVCVLGLIEQAASVSQTPSELAGRAVAIGEAVAAGLRAYRDEARKTRSLDPAPPADPAPEPAFVDPADHPEPEPPSAPGGRPESGCPVGPLGPAGPTGLAAADPIG